MKFSAFILSLCLLVYISEVVALPLSINNVPAKGMSCGRQGSCGKKAHKPCKKQQKDCNSRDCGTCNYCLNCPLCYAVTIPVSNGSIKSPGPVKKEYPAYQLNYLFTYSSTVWRPPNAC